MWESVQVCAGGGGALYGEEMKNLILAFIFSFVAIAYFVKAYQASTKHELQKQRQELQKRGGGSVDRQVIQVGGDGTVTVEFRDGGRGGNGGSGTGGRYINPGDQGGAGGNFTGPGEVGGNAIVVTGSSDMRSGAGGVEITLPAEVRIQKPEVEGK